MTPEIRRVFEAARDSDDDNSWAVLADVIEESGVDRLWAWGEVFVEHGSWLEVLRGVMIAVPDYARMLVGALFPLEEHKPQALSADAVNVPKCGEDWYARLDREKVGWVVGEVGNLEEKPWAVVPLQADAAPPRPLRSDYAEVVVPNPDPEGRPLRATVTVRPPNADDPWAGTYIGTVSLPNGHTFDLERVRRNAERYGTQSQIPSLPEWADEEEILQRGRELISAEHTSAEWREQDLGERVRLDGRPYREHLWMDYAPEGWTPPKRSQRYADFRTVYTDGGGYQDRGPEYLLDLKTLSLWARVADGAHGAETQCPRDEGGGVPVSVEDTACGESPGELCALCEEPIGEEHGVLSIGEGSETVYMRLEE